MDKSLTIKLKYLVVTDSDFRAAWVLQQAHILAVEVRDDKLKGRYFTKNLIEYADELFCSRCRVQCAVDRLRASGLIATKRTKDLDLGVLRFHIQVTEQGLRAIAQAEELPAGAIQAIA